ncbi:abortive phage infection protein [Streptomyces sp. P1-3]|uniref:abortive phage infection protein n=1 Tax=Streptomyces sp. P1-3 TaxID=3421658 RepID=UPI003D35F267
MSDSVAVFDRAGFLKRAAALGLLAQAGPLALAAEAGADAGRALAYRGVCYDTGVNFAPGYLSREVWSRRLLEGELDAIRGGLQCNSVNVFGSSLERLMDTSAAALRRGLHVWLQPRLVDSPQERVLEHLARAAREAERLRRRYGRVTLNVGCEYSIFVPGILPGDSWQERSAALADPGVDFERLARRLNAFVARAAAVARSHFRGRVTYASGAWESIDWTPFDFVGLDYYSYHRQRVGYVKELRGYRDWRKPIVICEFGSTTHKGAAKKGGDGDAIVDWNKPHPEVLGNPVRSEAEQARHIVELLDIFESQRIYAASVYAFIEPVAAYSPDPRYDLDMGSFGIVKAIRKDHENSASPYHWEPKHAFHALARHNREAARRAMAR